MSQNRKHLDITPTAPDTIQLAKYHSQLSQRRAALGLHYQTGARHGQQLAAALAEQTRKQIPQKA